MEEYKEKVKILRVSRIQEQTKQAADKLNAEKLLRISAQKQSEKTIEKYSKLAIKSPPDLRPDEIDTLLSDRRYVIFKHVQEIIAIDSKLTKDWVTISVISMKSEVKKTKTGTNFIIFTLSDLEGCEVKFFLFGDAYEVWWREPCGGVIGVLNALPMAASDFALSYKVEKASKIIKIGVCPDYGKCAGIDGINRCEGYVNL